MNKGAEHPQPPSTFGGPRLKVPPTAKAAGRGRRIEYTVAPAANKKEAIMKITKVEVVTNRKPIELPGPWRASWQEPGGATMHHTGFSFYKVHTDDGIVGIGPASPQLNPSIERALVGQDPAYAHRFWRTYMRGREAALGRANCGGLEIALWDIVGKAAGQPVYKLLGACVDKVLAYAVGRQVAPHVRGCGNFGLCAAATLQTIGSIHNCPFLEYPIDPPAMTVETQQMILKDPILIDGEGYVQIPQKPGIGVEIDEERIAEYL